jgi:NADPH:quinone reductase
MAIMELLTREKAHAQKTTMRGVVISGARTVKLCELPLPLVDAGQIRIKLQGCGVCHSNLPVWQGREWFTYPLSPGAPGHEGWGVIDAIGEGVTGFVEGERVTFLSNNAYAEYDVAPAQQVIPLDGIPEDAAFPGEPLGCVLNIFSRCDIHSGQTVAIIGTGFLGCLLTQLAAGSGAKVIALARRPAALRVAHRCGADELLLMQEPWKKVEEIQALTGGKMCERVIEATGYQPPLDLAGELVAEGGKLIIAGYHQDGLRQVNMQKWNWKGIDVINAHERDPLVYLRGMRKAIKAVAEGQLDPYPLFTHQYPLERAAKAS